MMELKYKMNLGSDCKMIPRYLLGSDNYPKHTIHLDRELNKAVRKFRIYGLYQSVTQLFPSLDFSKLVELTYAPEIPKSLQDLVDPLRIILLRLYMNRSNNVPETKCINEFTTGIMKFRDNIVTNNKVRELLRYNTLYSLRDNHNIVAFDGRTNVINSLFTSWSNILLQTISMIEEYRVPYGITTKGELMTVDEICPNLDILSFRLNNHKKYVAKNDKLWSNRIINAGYSSNNLGDFRDMVLLEQCYTCGLLAMATFINENNYQVLQAPFSDGSIILAHRDFYAHMCEVISYTPTINEESVKYTLPRNGVEFKIFNYLDVIGIRLLECFDSCPGTVLIICIELSDNSNMIVEYIVKRQRIITFLSDDKDDKDTFCVSNCVSLATTIYSFLVQGIPNNSSIKFVTKPPAVLENDTVYAMVVDTKVNSYDESRETSRFLSGMTKNSVSINSDIRRLPINQVASEEAKHNAAIHGIILPPGYTYVREFTKSVWKK
jgi:hypothetical protein